MRKYLFLFALAMICSFIFEYATQNVYGNQNGALPKYTGSPGDGQSCSNPSNLTCHGGTPTPLSGLITSNIPIDGYIADSTYTVTATVSSANVIRFGFEISPQNITGGLLGTMILTDIARTKFADAAHKYITHLFAGTNAPSHTDVWQFNWKAPVAGTGDVTFYGAFNYSNNNQHSTGDTIHTSTLTVPENPVGINEPIVISSMNVYPNPANDQFEISYYLQKPERVSVNLFDARGSLLMNLLNEKENGGAQKISLNLNEEISSGIYFIQLIAGEQMMMKKLVKL